MSEQSMTHLAAWLDPATPAVVIEHLVIEDSDVVTEARRWSTGRRGSAVAPAEMADADLGTFVHQALGVGVRAIASAGNAQDTFELERLVAEVGTHTVESTARAAEATAKVVAGAVETMGKAADAARRAMLESEEANRERFAATVDLSTQSLRREVERLFGGEKSELLAKLGPVLDAAGQKIGQQAFEQTDKLLDKVSRQFDPADPTSPFAKQAVALAAQQKALTESMDKNHLALAAKVEQLAKAVEVRKGAAQAAAETASVTPLKGRSYESAANAVMARIAVGLGDDYVETGPSLGAMPNCKKGDGVLSVHGGAARVVIEMHDSEARRAWSEYLDEAERNRDAVASIGLVPSPAQNAGQTIRVLGGRRVILAFNPETDDSDLLRTVVQLLRTTALAACSRRNLEGLDTAEEQIHKATELIERINYIRKASGSIRKGADVIDKECNTVQTGVESHLSEALDALSGVALESGDLDVSHAETSATGAA